MTPDKKWRHHRNLFGQNSITPWENVAAQSILIHVVKCDHLHMSIHLFEENQKKCHGRTQFIIKNPINFVRKKKQNFRHRSLLHRGVDLIAYFRATLNERKAGDLF